MSLRTTNYTKIAVSGGLAAGLLLSPKLWTGDRAYPLAPVFDGTPVLPHSASLVLYCLFLVLTLLIAVLPRPRILIIAALAVAVVFSFLDQTRLQPWFCQYFFMLAVLVPLRWNGGNGEEQRDEHARNACRFIVAAIYFYSGVQKLNLPFFTHVFPWMIGPVAEPFPEPMRSLAYIFGFLVPFIEMFVGLGLLFPRLRRVAVAFGVITMLFVLAILSPLVHNWNSIVWPWNATMAMLTIILFLDAKDVRFGDIVSWKAPNFSKVVFVLFGVMPLLSFVNFWDSFPSSALYSGNVNDADLFFGASVRDALPELLKKITRVSDEHGYEINITDWSFKEVNAPAYPEARVFKKIFRSFCETYRKDGAISMYLYGRPSILRQDEPAKFACN